MARFLSWVLIIPLGAAVVAFTISNRGRVLIDLWPAPFSFETPASAAVLVAAFGAIGVYLSVGLLWEPARVLIHSGLLAISVLLLHEMQHLGGNRAHRVLFDLVCAPARWWLFVLLFLL